MEPNTSSQATEAATRDAFVMALTIAPDLWLEALGEPLRKLYDEEKAKARPLSNLQLTNAGDATVRIDGRVRPLPVPLVPGTHLVQIGKGNAVEERRDVVILAGQGALLDLGRSLTVEKPTRPQSAPLDIGVSLWGAVGFGLAAGEALDVDGQSEPATKLAVPLELGATVELGPAWIRAQGGWAPLLGGGELLYLSGDEVRGAPGFIQAGGAAGASFEGFHAGALAALTIPSRTSLRALVGRDIVGPLGAEFRGGINLHPERAAEPAFELLVRIQPSLL